MKTRQIINEMEKIMKVLRENDSTQINEIIDMCAELDYKEFDFLSDFIIEIRNNCIISK